MATYKLFNQAHPNGTTDQTSTVIRTDVTPNLFIPMIDPSNTDYQEYLAWVALGNTAQAAD